MSLAVGRSSGAAVARDRCRTGRPTSPSRCEWSRHRSEQTDGRSWIGSTQCCGRAEPSAGPNATPFGRCRSRRAMRVSSCTCTTLWIAAGASAGPSGLPRLTHRRTWCGRACPRCVAERRQDVRAEELRITGARARPQVGDRRPPLVPPLTDRDPAEPRVDERALHPVDLDDVDVQRPSSRMVRRPHWCGRAHPDRGVRGGRS